MKFLEIIACYGKVCLQEEHLRWCAESCCCSTLGALGCKVQVLQVYPHPVSTLNKTGSNYPNSTVEHQPSNPSWMFPVLYCVETVRGLGKRWCSQWLSTFLCAPWGFWHSQILAQRCLDLLRPFHRLLAWSKACSGHVLSAWGSQARVWDQDLCSAALADLYRCKIPFRRMYPGQLCQDLGILYVS